MSDRLELANAIVAAGIERDKAERLASVLFDTIRDNVATKADVAAVRADLGANAASLKADIAMLRSDLRMTDSAGKADIAAVESKLTRVEHRLLTRLGAVVVVAVGIILAAMRYLPPVHLPVSFALDHAAFDEFVWRDGAGLVHFASQRQLPLAKRHRDRVWPALSRYKRPRARKTDAWCRRRSSLSGIKTTCSIEKAAMLSVLRRWCPDSRLDAWHMAVCDHAQRPPRYDPW